MFLPGLVLFMSVLQISAAAPTRQSPDRASEGQSLVRATELKTAHVVEPLGIDTFRPRFRWLLESSERGQLQSAYQVLVATSLEKLEAGIGNKWDSGKVRSDNSVEVFYGAGGIASGERAYWKVRIWDGKGKISAYSIPSSFEMGLLKTSAWKGQWIAAPKGLAAPMSRRALTVHGPVRRARLYICRLGYYELSINGQKIGDRVLDPATTYYHNDQPFKLGSRVLYATYDVTAALRAGENAIGVMLGNGWYSSELDPAGLRQAYGDRPRFILQMDVELANGRMLQMISDVAWKTSPSPISYNDLFNGEMYDARLEQPGWNAPGFNDAAWERGLRGRAVKRGADFGAAAAGSRDGDLARRESDHAKSAGRRRIADLRLRPTL